MYLFIRQLILRTDQFEITDLILQLPHQPVVILLLELLLDLELLLLLEDGFVKVPPLDQRTEVDLGFRCFAMLHSFLQLHQVPVQLLSPVSNHAGMLQAPN